MTASLEELARGGFLPRPVHHFIARRAVRLSRERGLADLLEFHDALTPGERRLAFAVLARTAGEHLGPATVHDDPAHEREWTDEELRGAHFLWMSGVKAPWLKEANVRWKRLRVRLERTP